MRKRDVEILISLLQDYGKDASLAKLADTYGVTERTLRNDLRMINDYLKSLQLPGVCIQTDGNLEFEGTIDAQLVLKHLNNIDTYAYHMQINEREDIILVILLTRNGYVKMDELASILFVSRSSIVKDINWMKGRCVERGFEIQSMPGLGVAVKADEAVCRRELFRIITNNVTLEAHKGGIFQYILLRELHFDIPLEKLEKLVRQNEKKRHVHLSDEGYVWLTCYLFVTANRVKKNHFLSSYAESGKRADDIAMEFYEDIMKELELPYTEADLNLFWKETRDWKLLLRNGFDEEYIVLENYIVSAD